MKRPKCNDCGVPEGQQHQLGCISRVDEPTCHCECATGGPCEHKFQGWRAFINGGGGETVCKRCGLGAMSHSLRISE